MMEIRRQKLEKAKIWVRGELSPEPYIPCYMTQVERNGTRAQRGANDSEQVARSQPLI